MDNLIADVVGDIALVLIAASLLGALARRLGQPTVVGQIIAGLAFSPSLLGRLPGHLSTRLFPHAALPYLVVIAQVAVAIFMFTVAYELEWERARSGYRPVLLIAVITLLVPMGLGSGAAIVLSSRFAALGQTRSSHSFILFMGVAISITALPVLAAIAREHGIADTQAGIVATTAAGLMDVAAWVVLAAALVGTTARPGRPWPVILALASAFTLVMLLAVRPALRWWLHWPRAAAANVLPLALVLTMGSAWVTASLGLHPVFGGLLAGFTLPGKDGTPDPRVLRSAREVSDVLLPLFFVVTGLSVNIGTLDGNAIVVLAVLLTLAIAGKLGPGYVSSRLAGMTSRDAATVAALVNTRGLTELIALNVGLSAGLISQRLFSILVVLAVLTTLMTAPLLAQIDPVKMVPATERQSRWPPGSLPAVRPVSGARLPQPRWITASPWS